jgi:ribosomal RNA assembly protein
MEDYAYELRIPKERVAVLIGKNGEVKKEIENLTKTELDIDSKEGDVKIQGQDPLLLYSAREIIRAIGRGFNPETALLLIKQDYGFELINMNDYAKTKNDLIRLRGRLIGEEGKARKLIEQLADIHMVVYGKTTGILGRIEDLPKARKAIEMLLKGSPHSNVYKMLEKK